MLGEPGGGGEYIVQEGFGWTNGVILYLLKEFGTKLGAPKNCPKFSFERPIIMKEMDGEQWLWDKKINRVLDKHSVLILEEHSSIFIGLAASIFLIILCLSFFVIWHKKRNSSNKN